MVTSGGYFDAHFTYPIDSPKSVFTIESLVDAELGSSVKLAIRYIPLDGSTPGIDDCGRSWAACALDPAWCEAAFGFVKLGVEHILTGIDHMLFLLCLVIPFRRVKPLIPVITAFTLGHSITLIGTAYNLAPLGAWFPPFVEAAIAATIFYMAIENIVGANLRRRWIIAALFGLVHGFGFADILREQLQFAGSYVLVSLVSFNIGIEIGQLLVLCVAVPALALLFRGAMSGRMGDDRAVGDRRQCCLAMDYGARRDLLADSMAATDRAGADGPGALGPGLGPRHRRRQPVVEMA